MRLSELLQCVHPLLFEDGGEGFEYTGGGTFFFARHSGKYYGITAKHCLKLRDKETIRLFVEDASDGSDFIPVRQLHTIDEPIDGNSDWSDLAFMELRDEMLGEKQKTAHWFVDCDYLMAHDVTSSEGDQLVTRGCPNCIGEIDYEIAKIRNGYFAVDGHYAGKSYEPHIHRFQVSDYSQIKGPDGMSGSPVFKVKKWALGMDYWFAGVVLRSTKESQIAHFVDSGVVFHALTVLAKRKP